MKETDYLPRVLVIDDLFGRSHTEMPNAERASLCGQYLMRDVTGDEPSFAANLRIKKPIANAHFLRGQKPAKAVVGDVVENDLEGILETIRQGWFGGESGQLPWSLVLLDLCFYTGRVTAFSNSKLAGVPEGRPDDKHPSSYFGIKALSAITKKFPDLPVVILSSQSRDEISRESSFHGALSFLPRVEESSAELLHETIERYGLIADPAGQILGTSKELLLALREARQAASRQSNILIRGERGTGKDLLAHYIHRYSPKSNRPYVVVNSGTLTPQLYASELFGYRKGAFTGAASDRVGKIVQASGGDLFLDEIGSLPMDVQNGLLRVLEQRELSPLGSTEKIIVDVRFLSATNEPLEALIQKGLFREDLFDRLSEGTVLSLPPLRDRSDDIPLLATELLKQAGTQTHSDRDQTLEPEVIEYFRSYDWPGNIRELRNTVARIVNRYPDVDHVFLRHVDSDQVNTLKEAQTTPQPEPIEKSITNIDLVLLLSSLAEFNVCGIDFGELPGIYELAEESLLRLRARLLSSALEGTRQRTADNPKGIIRIHPAVKLLTGKTNISASKAADIVKRLLGHGEYLGDLIASDRTLAEALERALKLRPKSTINK